MPTQNHRGQSTRPPIACFVFVNDLARRGLLPLASAPVAAQHGDHSSTYTTTVLNRTGSVTSRTASRPHQPLPRLTFLEKDGKLYVLGLKIGLQNPRKRLVECAAHDHREPVPEPGSHRNKYSTYHLDAPSRRTPPIEPYDDQQRTPGSHSQWRGCGLRQDSLDIPWFNWRETFHQDQVRLMGNPDLILYRHRFGHGTRPPPRGKRPRLNAAKRSCGPEIPLFTDLPLPPPQ